MDAGNFIIDYPEVLKWKDCADLHLKRFPEDTTVIDHLERLEPRLPKIKEIYEDKHYRKSDSIRQIRNVLIGVFVGAIGSIAISERNISVQKEISIENSQQTQKISDDLVGSLTGIKETIRMFEKETRIMNSSLIEIKELEEKLSNLENQMDSLSKQITTSQYSNQKIGPITNTAQ